MQRGDRRPTRTRFGQRSGLKSQDVEPERCAECGFDGTRLTVADAVTALRSFGQRWRRVFEGVPEDVLRRRPNPGVWSSLEYAAHARDSFAMLGWGMNEILKGEEPELPVIEPDGLSSDGAAADHGYNALEPAQVMDELEANSTRVAARAERELPEHWSRAARMGSEAMDAGWVLRHAVHEGSHHLRDVEKVLDELGR